MKSIWILIVAGSLGSVALAAAPANFSRQVAVGAHDRVSVSNVAGSVVITAWDRAQVDIQGVLESGVQRVDVRQEPGSLDIRVILQSRPTRTGRAELRIMVPAAAYLEASTVSASISVSGVSGRTRLDSVSGSIRSQMSGTHLDVESVSGSIDLAGTGARGRTRATSVSGSVTITDVMGEVEARSTSGRLDVRAKEATEVRLRSVSGSINYRGSLARNGNLDAESISGSVQVIAQAAAGYRYNLSSFSGGLSSCFHDRAVDSDGNKGRKRLNATQGQGQATVSAKTLSGSIRFCER